MIPFLQHLRTTLDTFYPGAFNAALAALLFGALWLLRKFRPLFFAKLPPALQGWPAMASGAVIAALSASTDGNFGGAVVNALGMALTGLLSGVMASGIHRTLKESPLPYGTNDVPPKKPATPLVGLVFLLAFTLPSCASFGHWSAAALPDVAALCALSGDVQPQLDALAEQYGVPVAYVEEAFRLACAETAKTAPNEAKHAGFSAARASSAAAHKMGARFEK